MILRSLLNKEDYRLYIGVGQTCLIIGALGMLLGTSELLDSLIKTQSVLDFVHGLFVGLSGAIIGFSLVLNIKGLILLRRSSET